MKNKKKFLLILVMAIMLTLSFTVVACSKKNEAGLSIYNADGQLAFDGDHHTVNVEYGAVYAFPQNAAIGSDKVTATLALYDASNNELKLAYGSYTFREVGEYRAVYTANGKTLTVNVTCRDTVAPVIKVVNYALYGIEGETVALPNCTFSDLAGIDEASVTYTVTDPDGAAVTVTDGKFTLTKVGKYTVKVSVKDKNGVSAEQTLTTECRKKYIDTEKTDENVIYTFNNTDYLNLVQNVNTEDKITREIVTSGYPTIAGEASGNGVLKMTSDKVYGDVRTKFLLHEDLLASKGHDIIVRFAVSKATDYVKLYRSESEMTDKGTVAQLFGLEAGKWYELTVCPIAFGYNVNFKDFVISYRDVGGVEMYIDSIEFAGKAYIPPRYNSSGKTVLADFNSDKYGVNLYQNLYSQPTTTMGRVDGTVFELLPEDDAKIPGANAANTAAPNDGARNGVLHGKITAQYGGLTYMFPEPLDLDQVNSLAVHMFAKSEHSAVVFGFFDGRGYDSAVQRWYDAGKELLYTPDQWREYVFSNEMLRKICVDGKVSGMYFYCYLKGDASAYPDYKPGTEYTCDFYLDEITVRYKENPSEQKDGTIATFENGKLTNVRDNWVMDNTAEFAIEDGFGSDQTKVLSVTSNKAGDGFIYLFDETVKLEEKQFLQLDLGLVPDAFTTVDVGIVYAKDLVKSIAKLEPAKYAGNMQRVILSYEQVRDVTADAKVQGIHVTTTAAKGAKLYVDNIRVNTYDASKDVDLPEVVKVTDSKACLPLNTPLDLSSLQVEVTDPSDPAPTYKVVSVTDPNGVAVTVTDNKFTPTQSGYYKVTVRGIDAAENESEKKTDKTLTLTVQLFDLSIPAQRKAYYAEQLKFELPSSMLLVSSAGLGSARMVDDKNATGGRALEVTFGSFLENSVTIDLGDVCTVAEVKAIKVNYRIVKQKSTDVLYLNNYTEQMRDPDNPESNVSHIGWFDYTKTTYGTHMVSFQKENFTDRKIPLTAVLNELHICSSNVNGDPTGKILINTIEIVYLDTVAPTITVPAGKQKLGAKYDGTVDLNGLNVSVSDNLDLQPGWEVVSLHNGAETVAVTADKKFKAPAQTATYTAKVKGVDAAGNKSEEATVTFDVQPYMTELKLTFDSADSLNLIPATDKTAHGVQIVNDSTATGGKCLETNVYPINFKADQGYGALRIDLGEYAGCWMVDDVVKISFNVKWRELTSGEWDAIADAEKEAGGKVSGGWCRFFLNGNTAQNGAEGPHHIAYMDNSAAQEGKWQTAEAAATTNIIDRGIPATEKLEYIQFAGPQWNSFYKAYIESITITFKEKDEAAPTIAAPAEQNIAADLVSDTVDLSKLNIKVTDNTDPNPVWEVVSLKKVGSDTNVTVTDKKFTVTPPQDNGKYTLVIKAHDIAGNESEEKTITLNVQGYEKVVQNFNADAALNLVDSTDKTTHKVAIAADTTATGGKALTTKIYPLDRKADDNDPIDGALKIDLNSFLVAAGHTNGLTVGDIKAIIFKLKYTEMTDAEWTAAGGPVKADGSKEVSGGVGRIYLNNNTAQNGEDGPHHIAWINTSGSVAGQWQTQEAPIANIVGRGIKATEKLQYILIAGAQYNSFYNLAIDSITIVLKGKDIFPPTMTVPAGTQTVEVVKGSTTADLSGLNITVTDADDPKPTWEVVSLKKGETDITVTDKKFTLPATGAFDGTYTLTVKAKDASLNETEPVTVTFKLAETVKLTFNADNLNLIAENQRTAHSVSLTEDGLKTYIFPSNFKGDEKAQGYNEAAASAAYGPLKIDLNNFLVSAGFANGLTVADIEKISVKVKFVKWNCAADATDSEWDTVPGALAMSGHRDWNGMGRIYLNNNTAQNGENGPHHIGWIAAGTVNSGVWQTSDSPAESNIIGRGIAATEKLEYLQISGSQYDSFLTVYIESITITVKQPATAA